MRASKHRQRSSTRLDHQDRQCTRQAADARWYQSTDISLIHWSQQQLLCRITGARLPMNINLTRATYQSLYVTDSWRHTLLSKVATTALCLEPVLLFETEVRGIDAVISGMKHSKASALPGSAQFDAISHCLFIGSAWVEPIGRI
ncbi:hypothetical protein [Polaromonas sp. C04]|uniref:hypothetical protein n=1 Tax=Polaromonas sp. C04 TaxID=1945857 RepID=UPI0011861587|nr:hypothetical protein [Polaromonas sp. C04]